MSFRITIRAAIFVLVVTGLAIAQELRSESAELVEDGAYVRQSATLTTTDTLDLRQLVKPSVSVKPGKKRPAQVREKAGEFGSEAEKYWPPEVIGTLEGGLALKERAEGEGSSLEVSTGNVKLDALIAAAAAKYGLDQRLIFAVMRQESGFNPRAISPKGASGLMQLMPATARRFGVQNIFDPSQNIEAGARYLRFLLDTFNGDLELALAGYNAGENAVARYGNRIPPYRETVDYVRRIVAHYQQLAGIRWRSNNLAAQAAAEKELGVELIGGLRVLSQY